MVIFDPIQVLSLEMREFMGRYLSTGNGLVDMIIGFCIFRFLMHVSTTAQRFSPASLIRSLLSIYPKRHKGEIEFSIEGQVNNIGHRVATFTPTYKAILHRVSMIDDERIWHMRERSVQDESRVGQESVYEVIQKEAVEVQPGVFVSCSELQEDRPQPNGIGTLRIAINSLRLFSDVLSPKELKKLVQQWTTEYKEFKANQLRNKQKMFIVRFGSTSEDIISTDFHSHREFDNFFFDGKEKIFQSVEFFLKEKVWYQKRGIPHSLGILAYGEPGCGKTSFVKALLKHTKRHGVIFSINHNTRLETIERLMRSETICDFPVVQSERIYILEDVDAMGELVLKREAQTEGEPTVEKDPFKALVDFLGSGFSNTTENHMSFLLNLLDGVIETPGRIVVMTTNHIEKLDPALIRPGRVDIKIHFTKLSRQALSQILANFYETSVDGIVLPTEIRDHMLTPAFVAQQCRAKKHDLHGLLEELRLAAVTSGCDYDLVDFCSATATGG